MQSKPYHVSLAVIFLEISKDPAFLVFTGFGLELLFGYQTPAPSTEMPPIDDHHIDGCIPHDDGIYKRPKVSMLPDHRGKTKPSRIISICNLSRFLMASIPFRFPGDIFDQCKFKGCLFPLHSFRNENSCFCGRGTMARVVEKYSVTVAQNGSFYLLIVAPLSPNLTFKGRCLTR